ncbi:hypothetical protein [Actinomadura sp. CNU-125]|uniref:hypothetical protein n=1 Tax=Actinomadura sp. CNU-125 TaxID=1904961 RepID=UPI000A95F8C7|nr:hypothetical protein [Actinomadura sp. CNU-125]
MVPDLTMRGQDDPHGRALTARPPTIGRLAARVHALAARPADWWRLIGFDEAGPARIRLDDAGGIPVWLTTWPPGHGATADARVSTLIAGELAEVVITRTASPNAPCARTASASTAASRAPSPTGPGLRRQPARVTSPGGRPLEPPVGRGTVLAPRVRGGDRGWARTARHVTSRGSYSGRGQPGVSVR